MGDNRTDFDTIPGNGNVGGSVGGAGQTGSASDPTPASATTSAEGGKVEEAKTVLRDNAGKVGQQATEKVRAFAEQGKERAGGALDQLTQVLNDAAGQVDDKLGAQYGQYARQAASGVQGFSDQVKNKDLDELLDDARAFVRKSPAVAVGAAAALGFVLARLVQAGVDDQRGDRA